MKLESIKANKYMEQRFEVRHYCLVSSMDIGTTIKRNCLVAPNPL